MKHSLKNFYCFKEAEKEERMRKKKEEEEARKQKKLEEAEKKRKKREEEELKRKQLKEKIENEKRLKQELVFICLLKIMSSFDTHFIFTSLTYFALQIKMLRKNIVVFS